MEQLRIALVAPSGSGKSTAAGLLRTAFQRRGKSVEILKLALPLYELQGSIYRECGVVLQPGRQDQRLLEVIATEMRRIDPRSLVQHFESRLKASSADVVLNDDLRDDVTDWPYMRAAGFRVVRIHASPASRQHRLAGRGDLTLVRTSPLDAQIARIEADTVLQNEGNLDQLQVLIDDLVSALLLERLAGLQQ
jgi:dephospho-CoA kinase